MAEFPERVKRIFVNTETNEAGVYAIKLCINGEFKEIIVDDLFPCVANAAGNGYVTAFSKSRGGQEIWVQLLEKAWAKANLNYESTISGLPSDAYRCLTGAPVEFYNHDFYDEDLWQIIKDSDAKNYIISASSATAEQETKDLKKVGLVSDHAYSVISAVEVNPQTRLLKLRNPWGHQEWNGDWSDKSTKWTPELRLKLGAVDLEDGVFFISFSDYMNYYRSTTICRVNDGFHYKSIRIDT